LPLVGDYDRYGLIDLPPRLDDNERMVEQFLRKMLRDAAPATAGLDALLRELRWPTPRLAAHSQLEASYVLVDDGIYTAVAKTVAQGERAEWSKYAAGELERLDFDALFAAALPLTSISRAIYEPLLPVQRDALRQELLLLARFRAWGARLAPGGAPDEIGQCAGYAEKLHPGAAAEPYVLAARERYAGLPFLLEAVLANEDYWREFGEEYDEALEGNEEEPTEGSSVPPTPGPRRS
jgi:hypothetical protein